jgi:Kef-type K+ transport system membrane component KefB
MRRLIWLLGLLAFMIALVAFVSQQSHGEGQGGHLGIYQFLFAMSMILLAAKVGGEVFETAGQPAVLGELVFGVILGNLYLFGLTGLQGLQQDASLALVAEIGVILLLFEVGLETDLGELLEVGMTAVVVAVLGVIVPVILGYGVSLYFLPEEAWYVHLFAGATLAATSVGITARVLKDINRMQTKEARIILGAAVVDDVLGLIILAVASGIIKSISAGGSSEIEIWPVLMIIGKSVVFLLVAVFAGRYIGGTILRLGASAKVRGMAVVLSICHCFALAGLAEFVGLAPIVGAFAAGLVLREEHYEGYEHVDPEKFEEIVSPISSIFVPIFFVLMGLKVDLRLFADLNVVTFAAGLSLAAILGKQVCSLGVREKGLNRLAIGVGMIPRGEVGLIFAGIGSTLMVAGKPVFDSATFSSMIVMVMVTTLATPPILKYLFTRDK